MAITPAYLALIKKGGTPTALLDSTLVLESGAVWMPTLQSRRCFDYAVVPTLKATVGGAPFTDIESIDYVRGRITLSAAAPVGGLSFALGNYIPTSALAGATRYNLNMVNEILDDTTFDSAQIAPYHSKQYGLQMVTVALDRWYSTDNTFLELLRDREKMLIEITPGGSYGSNITYRGWFICENEELSGEVADLEKETLTFNLHQDTVRNSGNGPHVNFFSVGVI